ncbi:AraC family transcriptional regulator [Flavobacterium saliperosum S13]|uniref:AraC-type DNA-binding protein n=2 Tax=Flavobacterium saliperosum TaxID=329186 RepID=A0A1G4VKD2_9FLAO|nr:AraC family transcriptional regulator [Flavobacterium saliperosum]ESU25610.1 AraC family transcriptional regulator [Flavobacterium saliperosum S13]SCX08064.1 AraC-type DNA-binding protein [Flavobacterium saliperosum]
MKLFIKYMVSNRCKMAVKSVLKQLGLRYTTVDLGEAEIEEDISNELQDLLKRRLDESGLELMDDKRAIVIEKIKNVIVEMIHHAEELPKIKNSEYLSEKLEFDYTYLANLFSEATGTTIEHYIILHKIERVKELLLYDELSLSEIANSMNYSSAAHLSNQFKKITGLTPTFFKQLKHKKRIALEDIH